MPPIASVCCEQREKDGDENRAVGDACFSCQFEEILGELIEVLFDKKKDSD